jgi:hypothetical protein
MLPSRDQIERAAYERWARRGHLHGADREDWTAAEMDTLFALNYQIISEFSLAEAVQRVLGDVRRPRCRFCEESPPRASFSVLRPAIPELVDNRSLFTRDLCDECAKHFADAIDAEFAHFWQSLEGLRTGTASFGDFRVPTDITIAAYKALIRMALSLMPDQQLSSFTDTMEWVSNPDHAFDHTLFDGTSCMVYQALVPFKTAWAGLGCRIEKDAPFPRMLFFLGAQRLILQVHLPLCALDEDLDGTEVRMPQRSFSTGSGPDLKTSACLVLPLKSLADPARTRRFRLFR